MNKNLFVSFNKAEKLLKLALNSGLAVMLHGSPSSGKTAIGNKVAKEASLEPILFSLMDHEPTDICGLPDLSGDKATFKPFDTFPIVGDTVPEGKNGWLIMLDEFSSGTRAMQAAANKLLHERMIGNKHLHPMARVMAMGNLASDNAFVIGTPQHTKSRLAHLYVIQDVEEWTDWAIPAKLDSKIVAYTQAKPTMLTEYNPNGNGVNYPCARTLEMASKVLVGNTFERWMLPLVQGILGEGAGLELFNFCKLVNELATIKQIAADPMKIPVPVQQSHKFATALIIAEGLTKENAGPVIQYIARLPMDLQHFIFRSAVKRNMALVAVPAIGTWATGVSNKYMNKTA